MYSKASWHIQSIFFKVIFHKKVKIFNLNKLGICFNHDVITLYKIRDAKFLYYATFVSLEWKCLTFQKICHFFKINLKSKILKKPFIWLNFNRQKISHTYISFFLKLVLNIFSIFQYIHFGNQNFFLNIKRNQSSNFENSIQFFWWFIWYIIMLTLVFMGFPCINKLRKGCAFVCVSYICFDQLKLIISIQLIWA